MCPYLSCFEFTCHEGPDWNAIQETRLLSMMGTKLRAPFKPSRLPSPGRGDSNSSGGRKRGKACLQFLEPAERLPQIITMWWGADEGPWGHRRGVQGSSTMRRGVKLLDKRWQKFPSVIELILNQIGATYLIKAANLVFWRTTEHQLQCRGEMSPFCRGVSFRKYFVTAFCVAKFLCCKSQELD